jgi:hypothetical protein
MSKLKQAEAAAKAEQQLQVEQQQEPGAGSKAEVATSGRSPHAASLKPRTGSASRHDAGQPTTGSNPDSTAAPGETPLGKASTSSRGEPTTRKARIQLKKAARVQVQMPPNVYNLGFALNLWEVLRPQAALKHAVHGSNCAGIGSRQTRAPMKQGKDGQQSKKGL